MRRWITACLCVACLHVGSLAEAKDWKVGREFRSALNQQIGLTWSETPVREALNSLSQAQRVAIFLDRRVDPGLAITANTGMSPFIEALRSAVKPYNLGVGFVGPVVYVGPRQTAARIATLAQVRNEQFTAESELREAFAKRSPMVWENLTEPRAMVVALADRAGLRFGNDEVVPHDLWPAAKLPPMTLSESLTLVLGGFSMNFKLHERLGQNVLMVTRFPVGVSLERNYTVGNDPQGRLEQVQSLLPQAIVRREGKKIVVRSLLEDHWQLQELFAKEKKTQRQPTESADQPRQAFTLNVENKPVGKVLEILVGQIGMELNMQPEAAAKSDQLITFSVENVSVKELLQAAANAADLSVEIKDETVIVSARPN